MHTTATPAGTVLAQRADDLRVISTRTLGGPNVWHLAPVVVAEVRTGSLVDVAVTEAQEVAQSLRAVLPALANDARGNETNSAAASCAATWGDLLVRVTNELQRLAGSPASFGRVVATSTSGIAAVEQPERARVCWRRGCSRPDFRPSGW